MLGSYKNRSNCGAVGLGGRRIAAVSHPSRKATVYDTDLTCNNSWHGPYMTTLVFVDGHTDFLPTPYPGVTWNAGTCDLSF